MGATLKEDTTASQLNLIHSLTFTFSVSLFTPLCLCPSVSCLSRSLTITICIYIYIYTHLSLSLQTRSRVLGSWNNSGYAECAGPKCFPVFVSLEASGSHEVVAVGSGRAEEAPAPRLLRGLA